MKKLFFLAIAVMTPMFGEENIATYDKTFLLPVDWSTPTKLNLAVAIPKGFVSIQPMSDWSNASLIEFIPEGEEADDWSEIISIEKMINQKVGAQQKSKALLEKLGKETKITVLSQENPTEYLASFIVAYTYNGKNEVLGTKYLSGPYDAAGVQYTIRLSDEITQEDAVQKIQLFFKDNLSLIKGE